MVALVAAWAALVVVAPSFAWCSFAIFFLTRTAFRGWAGYVAGGATAAATAVGLFRMSDWTDIAMLLGPLAAGALLTLIYDKIERDAAVQRKLFDDVTQAQEQLAATAGSRSRRRTRARFPGNPRHRHPRPGQQPAPPRGRPAFLARSSGGQGRPQGNRFAPTQPRRHPQPGARTLRARAWKSGPLPEALEHAARQYVETVQHPRHGRAAPLPSEVRHALLRVTQSAVANIKLHARADHASVTLGVPSGCGHLGRVRRRPRL